MDARSSGRVAWPHLLASDDPTSALKTGVPLIMDWLLNSCLPSGSWAGKQEGGSWRGGGGAAHLSLTSLAVPFPGPRTRGVLIPKATWPRRDPRPPQLGSHNPRSPVGTAARSLPTHPRSEPPRGFLVRRHLPKTPWSPRTLGDPRLSLPGLGLPRQPGRGPGLGCSQDPTPILAAYGSQTLPRGWDRGTA